MDRKIRDQCYRYKLSQPRLGYATRMIEEGVSLPLLRDQLGHQDINTTSISCILLPEQRYCTGQLEIWDQKFNLIKVLHEAGFNQVLEH